MIQISSKRVTKLSVIVLSVIRAFVSLYVETNLIPNELCATVNYIRAK